MAWRRASVILGAVGFLGALLAQKPFREYPGREYEDFPLPADYQDKSEWAFARLMYPPSYGGRYYRGWGRYREGDWTQGSSSWTTDYPRADRHFSQAIRRLMIDEAKLAALL